MDILEKNRFTRWQLSCKISDKAVENRICVGFTGNENKEVLLTKIKEAVVKK